MKPPSSSKECRHKWSFYVVPASTEPGRLESGIVRHSDIYHPSIEKASWEMKMIASFSVRAHTCAMWKGADSCKVCDQEGIWTSGEEIGKAIDGLLIGNTIKYENYF